MKTWNERLSEALAESEEYQGNVNRFAGAVGVAAPSVAAWVGAGTIRPAKDIKAAYLVKACKLLDVRPEWILFGSGEKQVTDVSSYPQARVTDSKVLSEIASAIIRLQMVRDEVVKILDQMSGIPSMLDSSVHSHDMNIASADRIRRDLEAMGELTKGVRKEAEEHGKRRTKQQPSAVGRKN